MWMLVNTVWNMAHWDEGWVQRYMHILRFEEPNHGYDGVGF